MLFGRELAPWTHVPTCPLVPSNALPVCEKTYDPVSLQVIPCAWSTRVSVKSHTPPMLMNFTVIADWPAFPSAVALIVIAPSATPVTRPLVDTVARLGSLVDQVIVRPVSVLPAASFATATSRSVSVGPIVTAAGGTSTKATALDPGDRKSTRLNSSHTVISYAVFCLKKKINGVHAQTALQERATEAIRDRV